MSAETGILCPDSSGGWKIGTLVRLIIECVVCGFEGESGIGCT